MKIVCMIPARSGSQRVKKKKFKINRWQTINLLCFKNISRYKYF